jgi:hypothetical protein
MNANTRSLVYIITAIVGFVTLTAVIYAGVLDPTRLTDALKEAGGIATAFLGIISGVLARANLTPDS